MAAQFYMIMVKAPRLSPEDATLKKKLNLALDWHRISDDCWLVWTTCDAAKWYERLGDFARKKKGHVFICRLDARDRQGWMPKAVWTWLQSKGS